ncbi:hypothetical protein OUZ56_022036 [Daphnia magna]|uniref:Uncharacterized protein n=1 Tax=Daphnia magna TaxID=35525 RepID=A0ABR0AV69_9CRUS|nr:hypothetical protein OUZ56_022036 [Daphnia magna]
MTDIVPMLLTPPPIKSACLLSFQYPVTSQPDGNSNCTEDSFFPAALDLLPSATILIRPRIGSCKPKALHVKRYTGEGRRGDGHDRLPVNVYVAVNGVGVAFVNVMLEIGVRFQMRC